MTTPDITTTAVGTDVQVAEGVSGALWLLGAALFGMLAVFFIGLDQGMVSVFGADAHVHEFVHDARHALGFPCH